MFIGRGSEEVNCIAEEVFRVKSKLRKLSGDCGYEPCLVIYVGSSQYSAIKGVCGAFTMKSTTCSEEFMGCKVLRVCEDSYTHVVPRYA